MAGAQRAEAAGEQQPQLLLLGAWPSGNNSMPLALLAGSQCCPHHVRMHEGSWCSCSNKACLQQLLLAAPDIPEGRPGHASVQPAV